MWSFDLSLFREKFCTLHIPLDCDLLWLGCVFIPSRIHVSVSVSPLDATLLSSVVEACSFYFQVPFRRNYSICSCRFVISMGGDEFRILLCHHLELSSPKHFFFFCRCLFVCYSTGRWVPFSQKMAGNFKPFTHFFRYQVTESH